MEQFSKVTIFFEILWFSQKNFTVCHIFGVNELYLSLKIETCSFHNTVPLFRKAFKATNRNIPFLLFLKYRAKRKYITSKNFIISQAPYKIKRMRTGSNRYFYKTSDVSFDEFQQSDKFISMFLYWITNYEFTKSLNFQNGMWFKSSHLFFSKSSGLCWKVVFLVYVQIISKWKYLNYIRLKKQYLIAFVKLTNEYDLLWHINSLKKLQKFDV